MTDLSPQARALIEAARGGDAPPPAARARVRAALLARIAAGPASPSGGEPGAGGGPPGAAPGGAATAHVLGLKVGAGLGLVLLGAVAGVAGTLALGGGPRGPAPAASPAAPAAATPAPDDPERAAPHASGSTGGAAAPSTLAALPPPALAEAAGPPASPPGRAAPAGAPPGEPAAGPTRRGPGAPGRKPAATADSLQVELALLREAQAALRGHDPARALSILEDHAARFPAGALTEERRAARVLALCEAGRRREAAVERDRFLARSPGSPLAARVRGVCVDGPSPPAGQDPTPAP